MKDEKFDSEVIQAVCKEFGITEDEMMAKSRYQRVAFPRHTANYLLHKYSWTTLVDLGKLFKRNHTSVVHGRQKIQNLIDTEPDTKARIEQLENALCAGRIPRKRVRISDIDIIYSVLNNPNKDRE